VLLELALGELSSGNCVGTVHCINERALPCRSSKRVCNSVKQTEPMSWVTVAPLYEELVGDPRQGSANLPRVVTGALGHTCIATDLGTDFGSAMPVLPDPR
jgi:hypothetical protein